MNDWMNECINNICTTTVQQPERIVLIFIVYLLKGTDFGVLYKPWMYGFIWTIHKASQKSYPFHEVSYKEQ